MDVFLARQPIFNGNQEVFAYEILYRSSLENTYTGIDGDNATANVLINTFQTFGISNLTNGKPAFINFTEKFIKDEVALLFGKGSLVVEILETIKPNKDIIKKCKELKDKGYTLALDDFVYKPGYEPLIELADIIKVDFMNSSEIEILQLVKKVKKSNITLLAEKVETRDIFEFAKLLGFKLFQGYFFSKPEVLTSSILSPLKVNCLLLMSKVNEDNIDFDVLADIISRDLSLTYYLLKLVNSSAFGFRTKINSVKHAIVILGEIEIRKWIMLVALNGMGKDKPDEIVRLSLIRAKFAELISSKTMLSHRADDLFLAGLFSLIDVILNRPLEEILNEIKLNNDIKEVLLDGTGELSSIYNLIISYEKGSWDDIKLQAELLDIDYKEIIDSYLDTLTWYNKVINSHQNPTFM